VILNYIIEIFFNVTWLKCLETMSVGGLWL
jgi:hypothetical protein